MVDEYGILEKINKSKRKKLMAFLKEHDRYEADFEARIMPAGSRDDLPESNRKDKGTIILFFYAQNLYNAEYKDFYTLVDTLVDGEEKLIKAYKRLPALLEFIGVEAEQDEQEKQLGQTYDPTKQYIVSREKAGRPKHIITEEEAQQIRALRADGLSINAISKQMRISNRQIMAFCRAI